MVVCIREKKGLPQDPIPMLKSESDPRIEMVPTTLLYSYNFGKFSRGSIPTFHNLLVSIVLLLHVLPAMLSGLCFLKSGIVHTEQFMSIILWPTTAKAAVQAVQSVQ